MALAVTARVTRAFWMAIEALESEAEALRMLATMDEGDRRVELADQAEADARVLRELSSAHLPDELRGGDVADA